MTPASISVIILTFNEQMHIQRCIESVKRFADAIYIVDSYSTDDTVAIAASLGAQVYQNPWVNNAVQFNWALDNLPITTEWVMKMDADEYALPQLQDEILTRMSQLNDNIVGIYLKRRVICLGRWIRHGGYYPTWLLRIWRSRMARLEQRWMDEHIKIGAGKTLFFEHDIVDHNLNNLTWWTAKHNGYATREALDLLNQRYGFDIQDEIVPSFWGTQEQRRRWVKIKYASMPLFFRPVIYFLYRYFIKLGILDGKQGIVWHFLQGFWYRFLVDAKLFEVHHQAGTEREAVRRYLVDQYNIELLNSSDRPPSGKELARH